MAYAGQLILAAAGILKIPDDIAAIAGLIIGGAAGALQKAWRIAERAAAVGVEIPDSQMTGVPNVSPKPTDTTDIGDIPK